MLHIEEEPARQWLSLIVQNNRAISLLREEIYEQWIHALEKQPVPVPSSSALPVRPHVVRPVGPPAGSKRQADALFAFGNR